MALSAGIESWITSTWRRQRRQHRSHWPSRQIYSAAIIIIIRSSACKLPPFVFISPIDKWICDTAWAWDPLPIQMSQTKWKNPKFFSICFSHWCDCLRTDIRIYINLLSYICRSRYIYTYIYIPFHSVMMRCRCRVLAVVCVRACVSSRSSPIRRFWLIDLNILSQFLSATGLICSA